MDGGGNGMQRDEVQRVEVETETDPAGGARTGGRSSDGAGPGGFAFRFSGFNANGGPEGAPAPKQPVIAAWACLFLAWLFLGSSAPFTVFLGVPLALASILLGTVCLSRGGLFTGLAVLSLGSIGSFAVYLVGLFRFLAP